jgi:hypothetical protein
MGGGRAPSVKPPEAATPGPFGKSGGNCYIPGSILKIPCPRTAP